MPLKTALYQTLGEEVSCLWILSAHDYYVPWKSFCKALAARDSQHLAGEPLFILYIFRIEGKWFLLVQSLESRKVTDILSSQLKHEETFKIILYSLQIYLQVFEKDLFVRFVKAWLVAIFDDIT